MGETNVTTLGVRIRDSRERAGLSQGELGELAGLERTVVNKIETGARKVSALELSDIASALGVRMASFFREPVPSLVAHRMNRDRDSVASKIDRLIEDIAVDIEFLESLDSHALGIVEASASLEQAALSAPGSMSEADELAAQARSLLQLDPGEPALNLAEVVSKIGLLAFSTDLGADAADAGTILLRNGGISLVNSHNKLGRRRLALAHELGHYLAQDQYTIDWRVADQANKGIEARLDRFARSLLLPETGLRDAWKKYEERDIREIAVNLGSHFRVDMSTLARRAQELDLVDNEQANFIRSVTTTKADFIEFGLYMEHEMDGVSLPVSYQLAVLKLVRGERISRERALDLLRDTFTETDLPDMRERREDELWNFVS
ncbi:Cro/Cl family transcriptional regulator [Aeromicrobium sp. Root236]|uniref:helix-turn-helix domain-containing protein n=1 Tax=Aeromicrobium sp. Root236 TaxID=1736498 RepID=UPI0006FA4608|nr:XRE family transcriptional regulator [Aeromicrobium sp. Root236]KRC65578.1 Cro/Cl family transcriptional regulator [Aeromicrobium sp. Root236]